MPGIGGARGVGARKGIPGLGLSKGIIPYMTLVLTAFVFLTLLGERHYWRWDLTASKEHTLTQETIGVLKRVKEPIKIKAFVRRGFQEEEGARRLLSAYHYHCPLITYEFIDPERSPAIARKYGVSDINTFILEAGVRRQVVKLAEEAELTNAILRLMRGDVQKVYWLTGHGERPFRGMEPLSLSSLVEELEKQNYQFQKLNLAHETVPKDAALVVIAAPQKALYREEIHSLKEYLLDGGRLLIFLEPFKGAGLEEFSRQFGIKLYQDMVIDKLSRVMGGDWLLPMVGNYGSHKITEGFNFTCMFPLARSVEPDPDPPKGINVICLAYTTENAWAETNKEALDQGTAQLDAEDRPGPVCLAAIAELTPPLKSPHRKPHEGLLSIRGKGRLLVFGDVDFASNKYLELSGNKDLVTNAIEYLTEREPFITIEKRHRPIQALVLNRRQGLVVFWIPVVCIPAIILVVGVVVWFRRRAK